jgi:CHAD domain-containing protein
MGQSERYAFHVPPDLGTGDVERVLRALGRMRKVPARAVRTAFHDTFDWRLYRSGGCIQEVRGSRGGSPRIVWRGLRDPAPLGRLDAAMPVFAGDLPPGALRDRLESIIEMRALARLVTLRSRLHPYELLNSDGKTVLRIQLEEHLLVPDEGKRGKRLPPRLQVLPVKGYRGERRAAVSLLEGEMGFPSATGDILEEALEVKGIVPGAYTSKMKFSFDAGSPAGEAARTVLSRLLEVLKANEQGVKDCSDSEFLHDFRVAVRRTRSMLGQMKPVFPKVVLNRFQPEFFWLSEITSRPRDIDVYLLDFPAFREGLPDEAGADLDPLHDFLREEQVKEYTSLRRKLSSRRYRELLRKWKNYLEKPRRSGGAHPPDSLRPVKELAREKIWKMYRRAVREGLSIGDHSPHEDLHELRKTCKKLRYLLEFFQHLFPPGTVKDLIDSLKVLQSNLGEFQDLEVQSREIADFGRLMEEGRKVPGRTFLSMGMLVEAKKEHQQRVREEFAAAFAQFRRGKQRRLFVRLFSPRSGKRRRTR